MTVSWLAGNRIKGTNADRLNTTGIGSTVGGWKELARTTLGSAGDVINMENFSNKRYYMCLASCLPSGVIGQRVRMGTTTIDTGANYADRYSINGGADSTAVNQAFVGGNDIDEANPFFNVQYISNYSTKEKLSISHSILQKTAGAGTAPSRYEITGKWTNTSNNMQSFGVYHTGTGDYASGSEVVVLGYDPTDTHTTNFWEELASVNGDGTGGFSSGTFTAKKYLWVQMYVVPSASSYPSIRFNADGGANYADRYSVNGGADGTEVSQTFYFPSSSSPNPNFINMFIINNSANEKLITSHTNQRGTTGAGNASDRAESTGKWANTADQIISISVEPNSGNYSTTSIMKVWGSN